MDLAQLALLNALIGPFLPPLIAVVNQPRWPRWGRAAATVLFCVAVGSITTAANGELIGLAWPAAVLACGSAAIAAYHAWWKRSGITTAIENATSPKP